MRISPLNKLCIFQACYILFLYSLYNFMIYLCFILLFLFEYQITDLTRLSTVKFSVTFSGVYLGKNSGNLSLKYYNYMIFQEIIIKREVLNFLSLDTELRKVIHWQSPSFISRQKAHRITESCNRHTVNNI